MKGSYTIMKGEPGRNEMFQTQIEISRDHPGGVSPKKYFIALHLVLNFYI